MKRLTLSRRVAMLASMLALSSVAAQAPDTPAKPPRQLPPPVSQSKSIPAGVDAGTAASSESVPLGTPVMTGNPTDRAKFRADSAAARAAGRPKAAASAPKAASGPVAAASDLAASRPGPPPKPSPPTR
ncbi:MAG: hypothetical protein ACXWCO_03445 [Caldimonas sp.]